MGCQRGVVCGFFVGFLIRGADEDGGAPGGRHYNSSMLKISRSKTESSVLGLNNTAFHAGKV